METTLPNCRNAVIADAKLYRYLLNPSHPEGKNKARFYSLAGYTADNGEQLRADLLGLACEGAVRDILLNDAGRKYVVVGPVNAPNGRTYQLLTVWAVEPPDQNPRLITAYPN